MKTTSVYIDIFIVGLLNCIWIAGLLFSQVFTPLNLKSILLNNSIIFIIVVASLVYVCGILFDYLNGWLFGKIRSKKELELFRDVSIVRIIDLRPELQKFIDNHYSRLRISRALVINSFLITAAVVIFINNDDIKLGNKPYVSLALIILGIIAFVLSILSFRLRNNEYVKYITEILKVIGPIPSPPKR